MNGDNDGTTVNNSNTMSTKQKHAKGNYKDDDVYNKHVVAFDGLSNIDNLYNYHDIYNINNNSDTSNNTTTSNIDNKKKSNSGVRSFDRGTFMLLSHIANTIGCNNISYNNECYMTASEVCNALYGLQVYIYI